MRRALLAIFCVFVAVVSAPGGASWNPAVAPGSPRPGPAVLYEPLATTPILANAPGSGWSAPPLMVSGAEAYVAGEYLYQDYIYDSYGANTTDATFTQPETVPNSSDTLFGGMTGDVVYPTNVATYGNNAADILEFRARPVDGGTAYRVTLNTMLDPAVTGIAIGIDEDLDASTGTDQWSGSIGSLGHLGLDHVVIWNGENVVLQGEAYDETALLSGSADAASNQIEIRVPYQYTSGVRRHYVVAGVIDPATKGFAQVQSQPTATLPGGSNGMANVPPVFNVGFRFDEPVMNGSTDPETATELGARGSGFGHWRDHAQAKALAARDVSDLHADIDFSKLAGGATESHVPTHGWLNRLYVSHLDLGEGAKAERPMLLGKIQPYGLYVPASYSAGTPAPLHLLMHSLSCSYNQYAVFAPNILTQLGGERGSLVLTPEGRGPDGWYHDAAEVDVFEAWADMAAHYDVDPDHVTVGGYSMGGYGTYKMAAQYPDLFAKGFAIVGPADENILGGPTGGAIEDNQNTMRIADNLYNVPLLMWNGVNDELVPVAGVLRFEQHLTDLGLRHELNLFPGYDHFLFSILDQWGPGKTFLGNAQVDRDPSTVVYRALPEADNAALGLVHDHAYWVSALRVASGQRSGLIKAHSHAAGESLPVTASIAGAGTDPNPHVRRGVSWTATSIAAANRLDVELTGLTSATLWIERAGIDPSTVFSLSTTSDRAMTLTLAGSFGSYVVSVPAGAAAIAIVPAIPSGG